MNKLLKIPTRLSLRVLLILSYLFFVGGTAALIGYTSYRSGKAAVTEVVAQLGAEVSNRVIDRLTSYVATTKIINHLNAKALQSGALNPEDPHAMGRLFWHQTRAYPAISYIYFGNEQGGAIVSGHRPDGIVIGHTKNLKAGTGVWYRPDETGRRKGVIEIEKTPFDARKRPWFQKAIEKNSPVWSDIYVFFIPKSTGVIGISFSQPVYGQRGARTGVIGTDLLLLQLGNFLKNVDVGRTGQTFIVERTGNLIASSTTELPFRGNGKDPAHIERLSATESTNALTRASSQFLLNHFKDLNNIHRRESLEFTYNNISHLLQADPFRDKFGLDWLVVTVLPSSDFMGSIAAATRNNIIFGLVALLAVLWCAILTAAWISKPILKLNTAARNMANGDWGRSIAIDRTDEVGELSRSFDHMAGQLKKTFGELEKRSSELASLNEDLQKDIAQRIRTEEALRQTEVKYRSIYENAIEGIFQTTVDGYYTNVNPAFAKILRYDSPEDVIVHVGRTGDRIYVNERDRKELLETLLQQGTVNNFETQLYCKDGATIWASISARPVKDPQGNTLYYQGHLVNITENKRLEAQLLQAQKMEAVGTLAGGIAHDFNNLLMGIQGYASLLLADVDPSHHSYEKLINIEKQVRSGADLTRQLLGFARGGRYEIKPVNLNDIIEKAVAMFGRTRKEITIHTSFQEALWVVEADKGQIEQALLNLYVNASQAMPAGGDLFVESSNVTLDGSFTNLYSYVPGQYVKITVTDTGTGMDEKTMERIFEPFFTTKEMGRGTGLGLASVYGIIKGHNGMINVQSKKGFGSTFSIYLPASGKSPVPDEPEQKNKIISGTGTILLVDDETVVLEVSKEMLRALGYTVLTAQSGTDAIALYKENIHTITVVLLDMVMPDISGKETFQMMRKLNKDAKIILSSGYSLNEEIQAILDEGFSAFIQKPFTINELSIKIQQVLL